MFERYVFRTRKQNKDEPFEHFLWVIKTNMLPWDFGAMTDSILRDQITNGITAEKAAGKVAMRD